MSEHEPQPEQLRAAEYVLGTLEAAERAEVDADLLRGDTETVREVGYWEERLGQLGLALEPVTPPAGTWSRIALATGIGGRQPERGGGGRGGLWRGLAIAASVAALALAAVLAAGVLRQPPAAPDPSYASVIRDEPTGAGWLITAETRDHQLEIVALNPYPKPADKSLHLWLVPPEGGPISLGLLPDEGHERMPMPDDAFQALSGKAKFAVSLEPPGGSPEPQPTGKILWAVPVTGARG